MDNFKFEENRITNLEMETAIYGLDSLGHNALSLNAIIANRALELLALIHIKLWTN
jgi:uridine phosphorylase